MKSFKFLFSSFLSTVLIVSSPGVLAGGQLIEEVPEIYYLEEMDDGQNVQVTACYRASEGEKISGKGLMSLDSNCDTVVEVSLADLESFVWQLNNEIDSVNPSSNENKNDLGALGGIVSTVGAGVGFILTLGEVFPGKNLPRNPKKIALYAALTVGSVAGFWASLNFSGKAKRNLSGRVGNQALVQQLRQRFVNGENHHSSYLSKREKHRSRILQRFTDFLNEYGRLVVSESAS